MKKGTLKHWIIAILVVVLVVALFAIPVLLAEEHEGHDHGIHLNFAEFTTGQWIGVGISAAVLIAAVVLGIKFREKIVKFFRVYKSESKKIVWLTWGQTLKNSYVVLVIMVIGAAVLCALDIGLNTGFRAFIDLFTPAA